MRHILSRIGTRAIFGPALLAWAVSTCATNPVTGKKELSFVSESQEISMGREYAGQVTQEMGVYADSGVQRYVCGIGKELAAGTERPKLPWTFTVMDDPQVNAFALPGGYIFVTRGILTHMNSEAELAIGRGTRDRPRHRAALGSADDPAAARPARHGGRGDRVGQDRAELGRHQSGSGRAVPQVQPGRRDVRPTASASATRSTDGYDVRKMIDMFQILQRVTASAGQRIPEWQSTHPDPGNRIQATQARLARVTVSTG